MCNLCNIVVATGTGVVYIYIVLYKVKRGVYSSTSTSNLNSNKSNLNPNKSKLNFNKSH